MIIDMKKGLFPKTVNLGELNPKVLPGLVQWEKLEEMMGIVGFCEKSWLQAYIAAGCPIDVKGMVRHDLNVILKPSEQPGSVGLVEPIFVIEINTNFPEDPLFFSKILSLMQGSEQVPNVVLTLMRNMAAVYGLNDKKIAILMGNNKLKHYWGGAFIDQIRLSGLNVFPVNKKSLPLPESFDVILRVGDFRPEGKSQFSDKELDWLVEADRRGIEILNPLFSMDEMSDKGLLQNKGQFWLSEIDQEELSADKDRYVVKHKKGTGGNDVHIGAALSSHEWSRQMSVCFQDVNSYIVQPFIPLPETVVPGMGSAVIDVNVTGLVNGPRYIPQHAFVRFFSDIQKYERTKLINVNKGGNASFATPIFC